MTTTDAATEAPYGITFGSYRQWGQHMADRFQRDAAHHQLTIAHDDGIYRHLRLRQPNRSEYWYDVVTWPGSLAIRGDMGTYVFVRIDDMFEFFRHKPGYVNDMYWAEKCQAADRDGIKAYDEDAFKEDVARHVGEWVEGLIEAGDEAKVAGLLEAVHADLLNRGDVEEAAREALEGFDHDGHGFSDVWEYDLTRYTAQFLWSLHAIVWAIHLYDQARGAAGPTLPPADLATVETVAVGGEAL